MYITYIEDGGAYTAHNHYRAMRTKGPPFYKAKAGLLVHRVVGVTDHGTYQPGAVRHTSVELLCRQSGGFIPIKGQLQEFVQPDQVVCTRCEEIARRQRKPTAKALNEGKEVTVGDAEFAQALLTPQVVSVETAHPSIVIRVPKGVKVKVEHEEDPKEKEALDKELEKSTNEVRKCRYHPELLKENQ